MTSRARSPRRPRRAHRARDPAPGRDADGDARRDRRAPRGAADGLVVVAERAPPARAARADPRPRRARDPRDRARRRRRASAPRGRCRSRRRWSRSPRSSSAGRSSGSRTGARTCSSAPQGRGQRASVELALDADGRILALRGRHPRRPRRVPAAEHARSRRTPRRCCSSGCYDIPAVEVIVTGARTNKVPTAPYRGAGRPEASVPDRDDDRRRGARAGDRRDRAAPAQPGARVPVPDGARLDVRLRRLRALPGPRARAARERGSRGRARRPGLDGAPEPERRAPVVGVAAGVERRDVLAASAWRCASSAPAGCSSTRPCRATRRRLRRRVGSTPSGQGHHTLFAQIAADRLGVDARARDGGTGDTDAIADGVGSFAAARPRWAARRSRRRPTTCWRRAGRGALRVRAGLRLRRLRAVVEVTRATGRCACGGCRGRRRGADRQPAAGRGPGDRRRGPGARRGAERGASTTRRPALTSLLDYALLTAAEIPEFSTAFVETPSPLNPLGVKGVGEGGTIGAPAAVANALANALGGRRVDPPFTAEKVWRALR